MIPMSILPVYSTFQYRQLCVKIVINNISDAIKGFGKHAWDVPPQNISSVEKVSVIAESYKPILTVNSSII